MILEKFKKMRTLALLTALLICQPTFAYEPSKDAPSGFAMAADLLLARPVLIAVTVVSTSIFVVALPFSAAGGNLKESGEVLVVDPAMATFVRCLGCTTSGYKRR